MTYTLDIQETARRDMKAMSPEVARRIIKKLELLRDDLQGDVKRLVNYSPAYRLRVGDWRVLFDVDGPTLKIQRVIHRSKAYD